MSTEGENWDEGGETMMTELDKLRVCDLLY